MAELARRSGVAVTSIYAGFADKQAPVLAAHDRHREDLMRRLDERLDPARWKGQRLEAIVRKCLTPMIAGWWRNVPLIRAALLVDDREINERAALMLRHTSQRLATLLGPHLTWREPVERERTIDFAFRGVMAVMHQRLAFGDVEPVRFRLSESEMGAVASDVDSVCRPLRAIEGADSSIATPAWVKALEVDWGSPPAA
jgi:AcrR family transcriptional regulator